MSHAPVLLSRLLHQPDPKSLSEHNDKQAADDAIVVESLWIAAKVVEGFPLELATSDAIVIGVTEFVLVVSVVVYALAVVCAMVRLAVVDRQTSRSGGQ